MVDSGDEIKIIEWVRYRRIVVDLYQFSAALYVTERHQIKPVYKRAGAQTELTPDACKRGVYPDIEEYRKSRESVSTKAIHYVSELEDYEKISDNHLWVCPCLLPMRHHPNSTPSAPNRQSGTTTSDGRFC